MARFPAEAQQFAGHLLTTPHCLQGRPQSPARHFRQPSVATQAIQGKFHRRQRIVDLVGHAGRDLTNGGQLDRVRSLYLGLFQGIVGARDLSVKLADFQQAPKQLSADFKVAQALFLLASWLHRITAQHPHREA